MIALPYKRGLVRRSSLVRALSGWFLGFFAAILFGQSGCSKEPDTHFQRPSNKRYYTNSPKRCAIDEVREYYCDELLPTSSSLPAPSPYENCPGSIESHAGLHHPLPPVAVFDSDYTTYIRRRMPPGNSCCYSWCGPIKVVDPAEVQANGGCGGPLSFRESYCLEQPEGGTSRPMSDPFGRCPQAIAPPAGAAFSVPKAAPFDAQTSTQKRQEGFQQCCYSWCSKAPAGTGLERK